MRIYTHKCAQRAAAVGRTSCVRIGLLSAEWGSAPFGPETLRRSVSEAALTPRDICGQKKQGGVC